jgi:hypothetical protein
MINSTIEVMEDNQGCISFIQNSTSHGRTKHVDIKLMFIKDLWREKKFKISYCPTDENLADLLTKPVAKVKLAKFCDGLKLVNLPTIKGERCQVN